MKEKKFIPRKGQTDFTNIRYTPVINCAVRYKGRILLVKRGAGMRLYPGYWNGVSGFLDDKKELKDKVREELREELGLTKKQIVSMKLGTLLYQDAPKYKKTWLVLPVLVAINTDKVRLDWEGEEYGWFKPSGIKKLRLLPGFKETLESARKARYIV
ncbi:MAG: NUDIX domain-containing protein [bacterium]